MDCTIGLATGVANLETARAAAAICASVTNSYDLSPACCDVAQPSGLSSIPGRSESKPALTIATGVPGGRLGTVALAAGAETGAAGTVLTGAAGGTGVAHAPSASAATHHARAVIRPHRR
jgi:hypothetical protein